MAVVFSESSQGPLVDTLMPPLPGSFLDLAARACADAVAAAGKVKMLRTWGQVWSPRRPLTWGVSMPSIVMILMGFQYFCVHGIWYRCVLALVICDSMPWSFKKWCVIPSLKTALALMTCFSSSTVVCDTFAQALLFRGRAMLRLGRRTEATWRFWQMENDGDMKCQRAAECWQNLYVISSHLINQCLSGPRPIYFHIFSIIFLTVHYVIMQYNIMHDMFFKCHVIIWGADLSFRIFQLACCANSRLGEVE